MRLLFQSIHSLDLKTFDWCLRRKHRALAISMAKVCSYTANGPLYVLVGLLFVLLKSWSLVLLMVVGFAAERTCYFVFKSLFKRNRPPSAIPGYRSVIEPSDQFSFPSGHTSAAFFIAGALAFALPWTAWLMYPWAVGVGMSRVILGVHFPTDTLAGAIMGFLICHNMISFLTA